MSFLPGNLKSSKSPQKLRKIILGELFFRNNFVSEGTIDLPHCGIRLRLAAKVFTILGCVFHSLKANMAQNVCTSSSVPSESADSPSKVTRSSSFNSHTVVLGVPGPATGVIWALRAQSCKQSRKMSFRAFSAPGSQRSKTESKKSQNSWKIVDFDSFSTPFWTFLGPGAETRLVAWFARIDSRDSRESGDSRESEIRVIRANRPDAL